MVQLHEEGQRWKILQALQRTELRSTCASHHAQCGEHLTSEEACASSVGGLYNWKPIFTLSCLAGFAGVSTGSAVAEELINADAQHVLP